jgi:hypothetical protein
MNLKEKHLLLPAGFNPIDLNFETEAENFAAAALISTFQQLNQGFVHIHPNKKDVQAGWTDMPFQRIFRVIGSEINWVNLRKQMVEKGILEFKKHYIVGSKSMSYRISPKLMEQKWEFVEESELFPNYRVGAYRSPNARAYREFITNPKELKKELLPSYDEIAAQFAQLQVIDTPSLHENVLTRALEVHKKCLTSKNRYQRKRTLEDCVKQEYEYIRRVDNYTAIGISKVNGRMHNPITSVPKVYRKNLRYGKNKEKLFSVDCVSFQPALLASFYGTTKKEQREKRRFLDIIKNQDIYKVIGEMAEIFDRTEAKIKFITSLYSNKYCQNTKIAKAMKKLFPLLVQKLDKLREGGPRAHAKIAIAMQRLESEIMIQGVLKDFYKLYPGRPAFPIHDSFLVLKEDIEIISELIRKHSILKVGFAPNLKVEAVSL